MKIVTTGESKVDSSSLKKFNHAGKGIKNMHYNDFVKQHNKLNLLVFVTTFQFSQLDIEHDNIVQINKSCQISLLTKYFVYTFFA